MLISHAEGLGLGLIRTTCSSMNLSWEEQGRQTGTHINPATAPPSGPAWIRNPNLQAYIARLGKSGWHEKPVPAEQGRPGENTTT